MNDNDIDALVDFIRNELPIDTGQLRASVEATNAKLDIEHDTLILTLDIVDYGYEYIENV